MSMDENEFDGQCAIVTGAASGIGRAVAQMIVSHGGNVGCFDLDGAGLQETAELIASNSASSRRVKTAVVDVSQAAEVAHAIAYTEFERLDLLFNVAGIIMSKPLLQCDTDDLVRVMRANVGSIITMTAAVVPLMTSGGVVINTSSSSALRVGEGEGIYGASKEAVNFITRTMAKELNHAGIRVCAIGPGAVDTPMPHRFVADLGSVDAEATLKHAVGRNQLITEWAQPEEIANAMGFLASRSARYCTGTTLWIDGGANAK
jgi:NAD(P)-dependent dehydrogenase (short-subunit alcohol dehydrogenase family)